MHRAQMLKLNMTFCTLTTVVLSVSILATPILIIFLGFFTFLHFACALFGRNLLDVIDRSLAVSYS